MPYLGVAWRAAPALPVALVVAADPVVVAAVTLADVTVAFDVTAPRPRPPPLATGTVVTVEKVLDEVEDMLAAEVVPDEELDEEPPDEDAVEDDELEEEPDEEPDEELDGLPSILMLCQDPDISLYEYWEPPVE